MELDARYLSAALKKYQAEQRSKGDALDKCQAELKKLRKKSQGSKNPQKYSDKELQVGTAAGGRGAAGGPRAPPRELAGWPTWACGPPALLSRSPWGAGRPSAKKAETYTESFCPAALHPASEAQTHSDRLCVPPASWPPAAGGRWPGGCRRGQPGIVSLSLHPASQALCVS